MNFLLNCILGIAIGSGAILPGISSGVICVIFGIYEKLIDSILNFFKDVKNNFKFLFPIITGVIIGVFIFSNILKFFLFQFPLQTKSIFIGLILGSIPSLFKEVNKNSKFKLKYLLYTLVAFIVGIVSVILENKIGTNSINQNFNYIYLILSGFAMSIGIIVPGVSSTIILMIMGIYNIYLTSISNLYFPVLIPIGIGIVLGSIILMKTTNFLLKHFYEKTFYSIIGFTLGSIFVLLPNNIIGINGVISLICIILGYYIFDLIKK